MQKWETGLPRTLKEACLITQSAIPKSQTWVLSCVNGWLFTKVGQVNVGSSTVRRVKICSPKGEIQTMISVVTHAAK